MNEDISSWDNHSGLLGEGSAEGVNVSSTKTSDLDDRPGFDDRKAPGAFRTIGEVAQALGIRQHVLRYWEEHFPMLRPVKRSGNRRYYRPEDVELVDTIDRLVHRQGYTLRGARLALEEAGKHATAPRQIAARDTTLVPASRIEPSADTSRLLRELMAIRSTLAAVLEA
jgi:DNA-binding transcriptional MerR regulator